MEQVIDITRLLLLDSSMKFQALPILSVESLDWRGRIPQEVQELLDFTVKAASNMAGLPKKDKQARLLKSQGPGITCYKSQIDGDVVGSVGELFAFELLQSNLSLPGFSYDNWPSTKRDIARHHPKHYHIGTWGNGLETSDLVYDDMEGVLTTLLLQQGYLEPDYQVARPRYYIETKATMSSGTAQFHISCNQAAMMRRISRQAASGSRDEVYIILRVFRIGTGGMGFQIFVNPDPDNCTELSFKKQTLPHQSRNSSTTYKTSYRVTPASKDASKL
jgi:hypothetical protein